MPSNPAHSAAMLRPFADLLGDLNHGAVADQAAEDLAQLVTRVQDTGRPGKLTLTVQVAPYKGNASTVEVSAWTDTRPPKDDPHAGIFFPDDAGQLWRNDPRQGSLLDPGQPAEGRAR